MTQTQPNIKKQVVDMLLAWGDCLLEVDGDAHVLDVFCKHAESFLESNRISQEDVINACRSAIKDAIIEGIPGDAKISRANETYSCKIVPDGFSQNVAWIVINVEIKPPTSEIYTDQIKYSLDQFGLAAWEINYKLNTINFSENWHQIFGYDFGEITKSTEWTARLHPDDLETIITSRKKFLDAKAPNFIAEVRYKTKNGSYKWCLTRTIVLEYSREGKPVRVLTSCFETHARKIQELWYAERAHFFTTLMNNFRNGILVADVDGNILFTNRNFSGKYDDDDDLYVVGKTIWDRLEFSKIHYRNPEKFLSRVKEIVAKREIVLDELLETRDGRVFLRDYLPMFNDQNKFVGEIWHFKDATEQKKAEQQISSQKFFYESIINNIPAEVAVIGSDLKYRFVNSRANESPNMRKWLIGKTDEEYYNKFFPELKYYQQRIDLYNESLLARSEKQIIEKNLNNAQNKVSLRSVNPVFGAKDKFEFFVAYSVDITNLMTTQEALKASMETFSAAFNHSGVGMAIIAPDGFYIDVNDTVCEMSGYNKDELLKMHHHDFTFPEDIGMEDQFIDQLLLREKDTFTIEKRFVTKDNRIVLVLINATLVWNADNTPKYYIAHVLDITRKKELEQQMVIQNRNLELTKNNLINKINQLEEFNRIIAHNLRGPSRNIEMLAVVLSEKLSSSPAPQPEELNDTFTFEEATDLILRSSKSLNASLNTMMEITQIKLNKDIPFSVCQFQEMMHDCMQQLLSEIFEKKAIIEFDLEVTTISYPRIYLESIVYNLLSNALKYAKTNTPPVIKFKTCLVNDRIVMTVSDNGLGLDLTKYGNKLFMLNQVFHKGYDSKGVGLYITKTQVESLGGFIEVKSQPDMGSEFIVTF